MIHPKLRAKLPEIIKHSEDCLMNWSRAKRPLDRIWYTSVLFYRGEQHVRYDSDISQFRRLNVRRNVPHPVTNVFAPLVNSLAAEILRFDPKCVYAPQTATMEDQVTAEAGNQIIKVIEKEVNRLGIKTEIVPWLVLTGNAFEIIGYDESSGNIVRLATMRCPQCQLEQQVPYAQANLEIPCPRCQEQQVPSVMLADRDDDGDVLVQLSNAGAMVSEVPSPFEMFLDYRIMDLEDQHSIIRIHRKDVEWVRSTYPGIASERIKGGQRRQELPAYIVANLSNLASPTFMNTSDDEVDVVEVWHKPSKKFPTGFKLTYIDNDVVLNADVYNFISKEGKAFYPIIHYPYWKVPGTMLGKTPSTDAVEKQRTRNRIEAMIEMVALRMSNPIWLIPKPGVQSEITGIPGEKIEFDPNLVGANPPSRIEGAQMPSALPMYLEQLDRELRTIMTISEMGSGVRPKSVKSGYGLEKLEQAEENRKTPIFLNWSLAEAKWQKIALELFRMAAPRERYYRILGDNKAWTVSNLQKADIEGGVDIWPDMGGPLPKTHIEKLATLETLQQLGYLNPADPQLRARVLREYGMQDIDPSASVDEKYIQREHDRWKRGGPLAVGPFDAHQLHMLRHLELYKSEEFDTYSSDQRDAFLQHLTETQISIMQLAQQQAMSEEEHPSRPQQRT